MNFKKNTIFACHPPFKVSDQYHAISELVIFILAMMSYFILCSLMLPVGFVLATNTTCPTWLYYNNRTQQCECGYSMSLIECDQRTETVEIWDVQLWNYNMPHEACTLEKGYMKF